MRKVSQPVLREGGAPVRALIYFGKSFGKPGTRLVPRWMITWKKSSLRRFRPDCRASMSFSCAGWAGRIMLRPLMRFRAIRESQLSVSLK